MNKLSALTLLSSLSLVLTGCSSLNLAESSNKCVAGPYSIAPEVAQKSIVEESVEQDSQNMGKSVKEPTLALSDYVVDGFPDWMSAKAEQGSRWRSFKLKRGKSFSSALSDKGYDTGWLRRLRRSVFIDLTTIHDNQLVWVKTGFDGELLALYTSPRSGVWYDISLGESGPLVSVGEKPLKGSSVLALSSSTRLRDLSSIQRSVASSFLEEIRPSMDHDVSVILSKGNVRIYYDFTQITPANLANIRITRATGTFADNILVYVPEKRIF